MMEKPSILRICEDPSRSAGSILHKTMLMTWGGGGGGGEGVVVV